MSKTRTCEYTWLATYTAKFTIEGEEDWTADQWSDALDDQIVDYEKSAEEFSYGNFNLEDSSVDWEDV